MPPSSITTMRSARWAVVRRCAMRMAERPSRRAVSARSTTVSLRRSSEDVASSRMRTRGRARNARAERELLALAGREGLAALVHHGVDALGQAVDELAQPDGVDRGVDRRPRSRSGCRRRGCADRAGEEERLLGHDADLAAKRVQRHRPDVDAVDEHATRGGVIEAVRELGHGRLARPGRPDERDRLARARSRG